jgi:hypothetical protein
MDSREQPLHAATLGLVRVNFYHIIAAVFLLYMLLLQ